MFWSRGCNAGDGGEETSLGETPSLKDKCAMWSNGGYHVFQNGGHKIDLRRRSPWWSGRQEGSPGGQSASKVNNNMQPVWGSLSISLTHTWEEVAPFQGSILGILSVRCGLARIIILCASFRLVIHPPEENPGRALFLFSKEGLGARWRKELLSQALDEKMKVDRPL